MSQSCDFCFRRCCLSEGQKGYCGARQNIGGEIISVNYGQLVSLALDPVEKKPLYHFLPHTKTLSVSESGCNYSCLFCQNWEISQKIVKEEETDPSSLAAYCLRYGVPSVSYTYSEPLVWQDYMIRSAEEAKKKGVKNIMVTNGSFSCEALERIVPLIDAFNIDLKGDDEFYETVCKASLQPVLDGIEYIVNHGRHIEVTTMLIEGMHDEKMVRMLGSLLRERGVKVWHLSRFFPRYRMKDRKETSEAFLSSMLCDRYFPDKTALIFLPKSVIIEWKGQLHNTVRQSKPKKEESIHDRSPTGTTQTRPGSRMETNVGGT